MAEGTPAQLKRQIAGDVVTVGVAGDQQAALELLQTQPFVREAAIEDGALRLYVEYGETAMPAIPRALDGAGLALQSSALTRPSLDDVFPRQTGRLRRDILTLLIQTLLVLAALPFGLHIHPVGLLVMLALIALIGLLMASVSYALALWLKSEVPSPRCSSRPPCRCCCSQACCCHSAWRQTGCAPSPMSTPWPTPWTRRALFNNHLGDASVAKGVLIMAVLAVIAVVIAARSFGHAVA